ncbi:hypothetical protein QJS10_CPA03g01425 [Acorus calamus]|uniref:Peptidase M50 domain-containing protein n=1 Tax=Acorus calamus TaxID=4465 RepID=A0AAV9F433_ACOCL|nr:hypothetical protein QJS10_CPA03g01425 [Acorus calamus]
MNPSVASALREDISPVVQCFSCFRPFSASPCSSSPSVFVGSRRRSQWSSLRQSRSVFRERFVGNGGVACRGMSSETETEPERDNDEEKESEDGQSPPSTDDLVQNNALLDSQADTEQENKQTNSVGDIDAEGDNQDKDEKVEVASGSPLPGMKQIGEMIKIPKATIDILKDQVFGFDTFFVTSQEPYEAGVLFKGNLRGNAGRSYEKIVKRMQDRFGDQYKLFLLINPEDDKPVAVVVPKQTLQPQQLPSQSGLQQAHLDWSPFSLCFCEISTFDNLELLKDGLPGALVTALIIGIHEISHILVAKSIGVKLGVPYFVPSWQIGSFGAITRIVNIVSNREDLLKLGAAGPVAGFSVGLVLLLLGFILPPTDGIGIIVDPAVFHESFLAGGIAKLLLGDALKEGSPLSVNPLVIWAWAGLLINAINSIPAGELDGGRISFALWGRKASARISSFAIALLGISSFFNDVAFYWVVLIFFLQRGPIAPLAEEITDPDDNRLPSRLYTAIM